MTLTVSKQLDSIRAQADKARRCSQWALTVQITIETTTWSGGRLASGTATKTELVLPKYPIRQLSQREVASSDGLFISGDIMVESISPPFTALGGGGFTRQQLNPRLAFGVENVEVLYLLDGETTGIWTLVALDTTGVTGWSMVLRNTRKSP